jgi:hypothetical protein
MSALALPQAVVDQLYLETLTITGASAPCTYSVTYGALPPGIIIGSGSGMIAGLPTAAGTYTFTVTVTNTALGNQTYSADYSLVVIAAAASSYGTPTITTTRLPDGIVGVPYDQQIPVSGGLAPYSFLVSGGYVGGGMPPGLSIVNSGQIMDIPTTAGTYTFSVSVTDAQPLSSTADITIYIAAAPPVVIPSGTTSSTVAASGVCAPIVLVDVLTASGNTYFWSEHKCTWPSALTGEPAQYLDWINGPVKFTTHGSTQTDTATIPVQNISGNTVERDAATAFSKTEFSGALVICRIWRGDSEEVLYEFVGNVSNPEIDESQMELPLEGFGNYSAIIAPAFNIDVTCPLTFGSVECGSTSAVPCDQSYGGCLSINRFKGVVTQWDQECPNQQIAQPPPAVFYNPARPF